jgi:predicted dehydrogenase
MGDPGDGVHRVAVVGCGAVLPLYFPALLTWPNLEVVAWSDLDPARADTAQRRWNAGEAMAVEDALSSPEVDLVLNLTPSLIHAQISHAALTAGKSVYSEKPLAARMDDAVGLELLARSRGLRLAAAPDTFLGTTPQTARACIDDGLIGTPLLAVAGFTGAGSPERLDDPLFPGTLLDVGVYYVSHLVTLFGPVRAVAGMTDNFLANLGGGPHLQRRRVNTHFAALLRFASGAMGTLLVGFGLGRGSLPHVEVQGTTGTLTLPNPNFFDGDLLHAPIGDAPRRVPVREPPSALPGWNHRGMGLAELALAADAERPHRVSAALSLHLVEIMTAVETAGRSGTTVLLASACERPAPVPQGGFEGVSLG